MAPAAATPPLPPLGAPDRDPFNIHAKTLHKPRILCLHGGGTNARIFRLQCRALAASLAPHFRLVFAEAPFVCDAGPDVELFYASYSPFKAWIGWKSDEHGPEMDPPVAAAKIDSCVRDAQMRDDADGADGAWVGLLGFSQGAKVAASMLLREQLGMARSLFASSSGREHGGFCFAVLLAGRAPLVSLDPSYVVVPARQDGSRGPTIFETRKTHGADGVGRASRNGEPAVLKVPTIHVHGLADPGLELHRNLLRCFCEAESARVVEWHGNHRVPIKSQDVGPIVDIILEVARDKRILDA